MTLGEKETLMRRAAEGQKHVVIVDNGGQTFRGVARRFEDWYQTDSNYAALSLADESVGDCRLESKEILYIEVCR